MANRKIKAELQVDGKDNSSAAFRSVAKNIGDVEKRIAQFNKQVAAFNRTSAEVGKRAVAIDKVSKAVDRHRAAMSRHAALSDTVRDFAPGVAGYMGTAAIGAGFAYSVKAAANFEESLTNIQKKAGATTEQMAKMRGEIVDLGHVMPVPRDEIAKAFERGAAAGIPLNELKEFASLSVKVSDAWDTTSEETVNFFAGFHASMGIQYKDMKAFASLINDLGDSGIANEKDIGDFADRFGGSGTNFGLTPEKIAAYGATMLDLKMPAEVGARAMSALTSALQAPENLSKKAHGGLAAIVGDVSKFAKLSGDQKLRTFVDKLSGMTGQRRTSLLGALLGQGFSDEIARLVAGRDILNQNLALAEKATKTASNSVDRVYDQRMKLFNSQIQLLQNNVNDIAVRIGEHIIPTANRWLHAGNSLMADDSAREAATAGLSPEEEHKQKLAYVARYEALHPEMGRIPRRFAALTGYDDDLAKTGRGQISDVFDNLSYQELTAFLDKKYADWPDEAQRQQTDRLRQPVPDHRYSLKNLPLTGPMPGARPAAPVSDMSGQYSQYHAGIQAMRDAQPLTSLPARNADVQQTLDNLQKLDESGQATWRAAGEAIEQSGAKAGQALSETAGDGLNVAAAGAGEILAKAVSSLLLDHISQLRNLLSKPVVTTGGNTPKDFNSGRSMPPSVTSPSTGNGGGSNGGGGY